MVSKAGKAVYDETYHAGVNIIRGVNGSGKSTLANLTFYALGGDYTRWLPEALQCSEVFAEVDLSGNVVTIKRSIEASSMRPLSLFHGEMEKALASGMKGWKIFGYRKTDNLVSFSQVLFELLDFPEVTTEEEGTVTMHQILRMVYVDQMSPLDDLMMNVDFDSAILRSTIAAIMLGTKQDDLFTLKTRQRALQGQLASAKQRVRATLDVYQVIDMAVDVDRVTKMILEKEDQLRKLIAAIENAKSPSSSLVVDEKSSAKQTVLAAEMQKLKRQLEASQSRLAILEREMVDSTDFIDELTSKSEALSSSVLTAQSLGFLSLTHCPKCLSKLAEVHDPNTCELCRSEVNPTTLGSQWQRMKQEVDLQIKESRELMAEKEEEYEALKSGLRKLKGGLDRAQREFDDYAATAQTTRNSLLDTLYNDKGKRETELKYLQKERSDLDQFSQLQAKVADLSRDIAALDQLIQTKESEQRRKMETAMRTIEKYTLRLLKLDGEIEPAFASGQRVSIDFTKNSFELDGRHYFSASSMVLFKNAVRYAILFSSLELDYMRYPRFLLCDNMEDKGMAPARSQSFQQSVVQIANEFGPDFQIIYSTSMMNPNLEKPEYVVGEDYVTGTHTLKV